MISNKFSIVLSIGILGLFQILDAKDCGVKKSHYISSPNCCLRDVDGLVHITGVSRAGGTGSAITGFTTEKVVGAGYTVGATSIRVQDITTILSGLGITAPAALRVTLSAKIILNKACKNTPVVVKGLEFSNIPGNISTVFVLSETSFTTVDNNGEFVESIIINLLGSSVADIYNFLALDLPNRNFSFVVQC